MRLGKSFYLAILFVSLSFIPLSIFAKTVKEIDSHGIYVVTTAGYVKLEPYNHVDTEAKERVTYANKMIPEYEKQK